MAVLLESGCLLRSPQTTSCENERLHPKATERLDLLGPVAKTAVLREHRQTLLAAVGEPLSIGDLLIAIAVDLVMCPKMPTVTAEQLGDAVPT
jgi:hypothetical protein